MEQIYEALFSSSQMMLEQLSRQLEMEQSNFGPFWILLDENKNVCAGDRTRFKSLLIDDAEINQLCAHIDDGFEPVFVPTKNAMIAASQLCTERIHCGYMMLVLPNYTFDTAHANIELIEIVMGQLNVIADLIDKNNRLHQQHLCNLSAKSSLLSAR